MVQKTTKWFVKMGIFPKWEWNFKKRKPPPGCFLKWWYPQKAPKWSFLVGKPWLLGTTILGNPHMGIIINHYRDPGIKEPVIIMESKRVSLVYFFVAQVLIFGWKLWREPFRDEVGPQTWKYFLEGICFSFEACFVGKYGVWYWNDSTCFQEGFGDSMGDSLTYQGYGGLFCLCFLRTLGLNCEYFATGKRRSSIATDRCLKQGAAYRCLFLQISGQKDGGTWGRHTKSRETWREKIGSKILM